MDPLDPRTTRRRRRRLALAFAALLLLVVAAWHRVEPLPPGVHVEGPWRTADAGQVEVLFDRTFRDGDGETVLDHRIFDRVFEIVDRAERLVVIDMFLFNDFAGTAGEGFRPFSDQLTERLLAKKRQRPGVDLLLITDPINAHYGGLPSRHVDRLRAGGVQVVYTDLGRLRDSNPLWSTPWRVALQWFGNSTRGGWLPSPFDPEAAVTLRTYFSLLNFKANHRKVVVADDPEHGLVALVTSANPHDASSRHSNVAAYVRGGLARDVLASELQVARFSGWRGRITPPPAPAPPPAVEPVRVRFVTEGAIRDGVLDALSAAGEGDRVDVAMFYLSHRDVVSALLAAARRGARVRLVLDPNRDAFGREKDGVPNRSVAHELTRRGGGNVEVRWYRTDGEQFHTKLTVVRAGGVVRASLGSANLTRRNVDDLNLEANLELLAPLGSALDRELAQTFDRFWRNGNGTFTDPYERWADPSRWRTFKYRVMEATGLSTF
jgi:phosphatidylserine/phosphatidylglycerophosphate/cardiolipin synthase-like enzyme